MDETLKLILNKLDKIEGKIDKLEEGQIRLEKKIDDNFDLLFSEDNNIYNSLDKRINVLETKV
jgi:hypothetical protein